MRLRLLSDLHRESGQTLLPSVGADVVVPAGDTLLRSCSLNVCLDAGLRCGALIETGKLAVVTDIELGISPRDKSGAN